ncbi:hypothetical protein IVB41_09145 [Bradyrhizobium sp. 44]|uniref:hypothetical protein n=1 Tax=Bradyrhizobium sp. 44 TaxID=2782675 RepID=UPI001FFA24E1|nr:hypothetical protein [Bradyrhizobium sp. 44]MCK1284099.1 hypothetical protein [Bradyrhizobium sp. 44]
MNGDTSWEVQRWQIAIEKDRAGLIKLLRSGDAMPEVARQRLADEFENKSRHVEAAADAELYQEFVSDFKSSPHRLAGPITKSETDRAVKVMQERTKAEGRANVRPDGRKAATMLRDEQTRAYAAYYGLNFRRFKNVMDGKDGSANRMKR